MNLWLAFVGGIILGWLIEWVIDWYYWRRGVAAFYATETELRRRIHELETENAALRQAQAELEGGRRGATSVRPGASGASPTASANVSPGTSETDSGGGGKTGSAHGSSSSAAGTDSAADKPV